MQERKDAEIFIIPIEIRPDVVVKVQIPRDLTAAEARKIAAVVAAYVEPTPDTSHA